MGATELLLTGPVAALALTRLVLRRGEWLVGNVLVVRRWRTRRVDLASVVSAHLRSAPVNGGRVVELVLAASGRPLAVPVWRTRPPRGVDVGACDALGDRLVRAPLEVVALLRAQGEAVRTGVRPTPLDQLVQRYPRHRRADWPSTSTPPPKTAATARPRPGGDADGGGLAGAVAPTSASGGPDRLPAAGAWAGAGDVEMGGGSPPARGSAGSAALGVAGPDASPRTGGPTGSSRTSARPTRATGSR
jgi:hypothetical protein